MTCLVPSGFVHCFCSLEADRFSLRSFLWNKMRFNDEAVPIPYHPCMVFNKHLVEFYIVLWYKYVGKILKTSHGCVMAMWFEYFMFPPTGHPNVIRFGKPPWMWSAIGTCPNEKWVGHPELGDQLTLIILLFFWWSVGWTTQSYRYGL